MLQQAFHISTVIKIVFSEDILYYLLMLSIHIYTFEFFNLIYIYIFHLYGEHMFFICNVLFDTGYRLFILKDPLIIKDQGENRNTQKNHGNITQWNPLQSHRKSMQQIYVLRKMHQRGSGRGLCGQPEQNSINLVKKGLKTVQYNSVLIAKNSSELC